MSEDLTAAGVKDFIGSFGDKDALDRLRLYYPIDTWKRLAPVSVYNFTEDELAKAQEHEEGFIGTKAGVDCYVPKFIE